MTDIFDHIAWYVQREWGEEEPICVHVGNVKECQLKRHPTYPKLRDQALPSASNPKGRGHVWESMVAMGRLHDLSNDITWRMIILDCLTPCFRVKSSQWARGFLVDREDIRAAMVEGVPEAWRGSAGTVPPRKMRDFLFKAAYKNARNLLRIGVRESSTEDVEYFSSPDVFAQGITSSGAPILDAAELRNPIVAEQLRGERYGALFQHLGCMDRVRIVHDEIRSGRRRAGTSIPGTMQFWRSHLTGADHYYWISDLFPLYVKLPEAAAALGYAESAAYKLVRDGKFPCPVTRMGSSYVVAVKALMHQLGIPDAIVHPDDVENGAAHAADSD